MSLVLRYLCATFLLLVAIHCSQEFSIGYGNEIAADMPVTEEEEGINDDTEKRNAYIRMGRDPYLRLGKRSLGDGYLTQSVYPAFQGSDKTFLRIGRAPSDQTFLRIGRAANDKTFLRIGRTPGQTFLRIGRAPGQTFLRIGRPSDRTFLRIGRATEKVNDHLLAEETEDTVSDGDSEQEMEKRYNSQLRIGKRRLRIGKRVLKGGNQNPSSELTPEEIQLLQENKELLLQLLELHPELIQDDKRKHWKNGSGDDWSFYFPRMGRSGEEEQNSGYCCDEGVRSVVTMGQNSLKACPSEQGCCPGLTEKTKLYKDIIITECVAEPGIEKIRALIGDE